MTEAEITARNEVEKFYGGLNHNPLIGAELLVEFFIKGTKYKEDQSASKLLCVNCSGTNPNEPYFCIDCKNERNYPEIDEVFKDWRKE